MLSLLSRLEHKQKNYSNPFRIRIFLSFLLIWNQNDKYVHTICSSLEKHTRFQTKVGNNVLTPFSDQNGAKILPDGAAHTCMAYIREYPPSSPGKLVTERDRLEMFYNLTTLLYFLSVHKCFVVIKGVYDLNDMTL